MLFSRIVQDIIEGCPANRGLSNYRIVLLGQSGSGKTCFFNSLNSSIHGFVTNQAAVGITNGGLASTLVTQLEFTEFTQFTFLRKLVVSDMERKGKELVSHWIVGYMFVHARL